MFLNKRFAWATLFLVTLGALVYYPVWEPGGVDVAGLYDFYSAFGPNTYYFDRMMHEGDFPTWNPLLMCGTPFAANPQAWVLYPPHVLRGLLNLDPTPDSSAWSLWILLWLHSLWMAWGVIFLCRRHELTWTAALLAAVLTVFSALWVRRTAEAHFVFTSAWLPWTLLSLHYLITSTSIHTKLRSVSVTGLTLGLAVLGGFPQLFPYIGLFVFAYAVSLWVGTHGAPWKKLRVFGGDSGLTILAVVISGLIGAALLLPTFEFSQFSPRSGGQIVSGHRPEEWSLRYVWQSLVLFNGRTYEPETLRGFGVLGLMLSSLGVVFALVRRRHWPLLALLYVTVDVLIGQPMPLSVMVDAATPFAMVSVTRGADIGVMVAAILAGIGWDVLSNTGGRQWERVVASPLLGVIGVSAFWGWIRHLPDGQELPVSPVLRWWIAACVGLAIVNRLFKDNLRRWVALLLVFGVFGELLLWHDAYVPRLVIHKNHDKNWKTREGYDGSESMWRTNARGSIDRCNYNMWGLEPAMNGYDPLFIGRVRDVLSGPGRGKIYTRSIREKEIPARNTRGHLLMKRAFWLHRVVAEGSLPAKNQIYPSAEVAFVDNAAAFDIPQVSREDVIGLPSLKATEQRDIALRFLDRSRDRKGVRVSRWEGRWQRLTSHGVLRLEFRSQGTVSVFPSYRVPSHRRRHPLYRSVVRSKDVHEHVVWVPLPDVPAANLRVVFKSPSQFAVPSYLRATLHEVQNDYDDLIQVRSRSADEVMVDIAELELPMMLSIIDASYPGWHAEVDGQPAQLHRVNQAFKGLVLDQGQHRVRLWFSSPRMHWGMASAVLGLALAGGMLLGGVRRAVLMVLPFVRRFRSPRESS